MENHIFYSLVNQRTFYGQLFNSYVRNYQRASNTINSLLAMNNHHSSASTIIHHRYSQRVSNMNNLRWFPAKLHFYVWTLNGPSTNGPLIIPNTKNDIHMPKNQHTICIYIYIMPLYITKTTYHIIYIYIYINIYIIVVSPFANYFTQSLVDS
jgi:hypothetical protein